jgi:hypothetical protein
MREEISVYLEGISVYPVRRGISVYSDETGIFGLLYKLERKFQLAPVRENFNLPQ